MLYTYKHHVFGAVKIFSSLSFLIYIVGIKYLFHLAHTVTKDEININKDFCKLLKCYTEGLLLALCHMSYFTFQI